MKIKNFGEEHNNTKLVSFLIKFGDKKDGCLRHPSLMAPSAPMVVVPCFAQNKAGFPLIQFQVI